MAITGNGSTGIIQATSNFAAIANPSFHLWYRNAAAAGTAVLNVPVDIRAAAGTGGYLFRFIWDDTNPASSQSILCRAANNTFYTAQFSTSLTLNTWYAVGGQLDGTDLKAWLNGSLETTTAASAFNLAATINAYVLGGGGEFDDGTVAEFALWDAVLTSDEWVALSKGISPWLIRPASLVQYWELIRDMYASVGGPLTTSGGLTVADHYPMIYRRGPAYVERMSSSTSAEWAASAQTVTIAAEIADSQGDVVTLPAESASVSVGAEASSSFTALLPAVPKSLTHRMLAGGKFTARTPYLNSGRLKERP